MLKRIGKRKGIRSKICSRCPALLENLKKRYCNKCSAAYLREWRKHNPLTNEQRKRTNTRTYTKMLIKRGLLVKLPCQTCGSANSQAHHHDYDNPYDIEFLCRKCHMDLHRQLSQIGKPVQMSLI